MTLGATDLVLLVGSVLASAAIGIYFSNKNSSLNSYMIGDKRMGVLPVAVSLMTSCLSGLTLLGASAEFYYQGPSYLFVFLPLLASGPITAYTMLPVFHRMNTLSLYQYLQRRYGPLIKYIVTIVFMLQMVLYNAVVLYLPSMASSGLLGVSRLYSVLLLGLLCVLYSALGGLKAVVWSDLFQAGSMLLGLLVVACLGTHDAGGPGQLWLLARDNGRLALDGFWNLDLTTRHTLFGILVGSTLKHVYVVGVNQVQLQRALSLPSLRQGQLSFVLCSLLAALMLLISSFLGAVLVAAYRSCDPYLAGQITRRDAILVHYAARRLASVPGLRGLFVAGLFSATLSTLSSFTNSMAALAVEDFVKPVRRRLACEPLGSSSETRLAKALAACFGLLCVLAAYAIERANSRLLQMTTTLLGAIGVPFLIAFGLGIFTRFVNTLGVLVGLALTLSLGGYITIRQSFLAPALEPAMPVYISGQCARLFNGTLTAAELPALDLSAFQADDAHKLEAGHEPFHLGRISYMTLPAVQLVIMVLVAPLVSLLTGGWRQQVDEQLLVGFLQRRPRKGARELGAAGTFELNPEGREPAKLQPEAAGAPARCL